VSTEIILFKKPPSLAGLAAKPPAVFLPNEKARDRFFGFFTANIRNKNTRRAYYKAACRFSEWCEGRGLLDMAHVKPHHVAAYIELLGQSQPQGQGLSFGTREK
jgi:hypothetical protein